MIEPTDIAIAQRVDVEADITVADGDGVERPTGLARSLEPEIGLVEIGQHRIDRADHRHVVDFCEHAQGLANAIARSTTSGETSSVSPISFCSSSPGIGPNSRLRFSISALNAG